MPLYKRKSFHLSDSPQDLDPNELVFQVRFTKEIFRDYQEYLNRLNLYRQRLWTCKVTGKINLTYEEALVSEHNATERVQQFPVELVPHVLNKIQYSTLNLTELVNEIHSDLQNNPYEGIELYAKKGDSLSACKIIEVMKNGDGINTRCRVGWMDKDKQVTETSVVCTKDLVRKKPPLSRSFLKAFIRESTSQSSPWLVHEKLTKKHGIPTVNLKNQPDIKISRLHHHKKRKFQNGCASGSWPEEEAAVVYPIDDLLVKTSAGDPSLVDRPMPSTDFLVPMDCVGDLLMVWNFFISFGSLLHLWPFSFEDFENAICHKDSELMLMLECHSAVLRFLIKDGGDYFTAVRTKKRKLKVRLTNWAKYLCHFLEMKNKSDSSDLVLTIKRGHYGLLDVRIKLSILQDLVAEVLATAAIRTSLDDCVLQSKALAAQKREEARTKKKEAGDRTKKVNQELVLVNGKRSCTNLAVVNGSTPKYNNGHLRANGKIQSPHTKIVMENGESAQRVENGDEENQQREHLEREKEKLWIRSNCIGRDRNFNRYWFFRREGRLFVESLDSSSWGYYSTKEELDALMGSLNEKGERERDLKRQLEKHYAKISSGLQKKSKEMAQTALLADEGELRRSARVRSQPRCSPAMMFHKYINKWKERPNANKLIRLPFSNSNAKRGHKCSSLKLLLLDSPPSPPPPPPPPPPS